MAEHSQRSRLRRLERRNARFLAVQAALVPSAAEGAREDRASPTDLSNFALIKQAIHHLQHVVAVYDGHLREMCPHALGTKNGRRHVLLLQFGGAAKGRRQREVPIPLGTAGHWLCVPLEDLTIEAIRSGPWHTEEAEYQARKAACLDLIQAEIQLQQPE